MELEDIPSGGPLKMWLLGVVVALLPILHGMGVLWSGSTTLIGRSGIRMELHGLEAGCVGVFFLGLGAAVHFHYFWGLFQPSQVVSQFGKLTSALIMLVAVAVGIVRLF